MKIKPTHVRGDSLSFPCDISIVKESLSCVRVKQAFTLATQVSRKGIGLFSGTQAEICFLPAPEGHGIIFQRMDVMGEPLLPAQLKNVQGTPRCTILGNQGVSIQTVEHVLAALAACGIDNLLIQVTGPEVPVFDGSSKVFVEMIEEAGLCALNDSVPVYGISKPLYWSVGDVHIVAIPSDEYRISYTLHYPHSKLLKAQFFTVQVNAETFKKDIAPCRTFSLYEEILPFIEKGLLKGGSLENAVIIKNDEVMNPEGLRFPDEMVRHKIVDMIGDLSLIGFPFLAHIIAIRSGHFANNAFAKELQNHIKMEIS